ncbi:hypothetical protein G7Y89_g8633 [Cudoniella acicularis]|uniref:Uncharacterized protein n=1 Tax=Cudoniella acicularis TaxID=354080 RepID=A0A8H4RIH7_9HELO|nr:hypothetical protein G7Y89_g8633 [Cudoniella acicularis]
MLVRTISWNDVVCLQKLFLTNNLTGANFTTSNNLNLDVKCSQARWAGMAFSPSRPQNTTPRDKNLQAAIEPLHLSVDDLSGHPTVPIPRTQGGGALPATGEGREAPNCPLPTLSRTYGPGFPSNLEFPFPPSQPWEPPPPRWELPPPGEPPTCALPPTRPLPDPPSNNKRSKKKNARKRGPPGVKWSPSNERRLARLYALTDANTLCTEDIPVVLTRHAQEKLSHYLGDRPNNFRPADSDEACRRIEEAFKAKMTFKEGQKQSSNQNEDSLMTDSAIKEFSSQGTEDDPFDFFEQLPMNSYPPLIPSYLQELQNFAMHEIESGSTLTTSGDNALPGPDQIRSSLASFQSLERRMALRVPKEGEQLTTYSSAALRTMLFIKRRLSVGSLISYCSKTTHSSFDSRMTSWSTRQSTVTITAPPHSNRESSATILNPSEAQRTPSSATIIPKKTPFDFQPWAGDKGSSQDTTDPGLRVCQDEIIRNHSTEPSELLITGQEDEGHNFPAQTEEFQSTFEHKITGHFQTETLQAADSTSQSSQAFEKTVELWVSDTSTRGRYCCLDLRRGDPRASLCKVCQLMEPECHLFISLLVENRHSTSNQPLDDRFRDSGLNVSQLHDVDMFYDTSLHAAARHGAGSTILTWLISMGVNVHAQNAAGQTFLHVLNPMAFQGNTYIEQSDDIDEVLAPLRERRFDFFHRDHYGQTPLHVLTRYWAHSDFIAAAIRGMHMTAESKPPGRDFRLRTIDMQLGCQGRKSGHYIADYQRKGTLASFLRPKPLQNWHEAPKCFRPISEQSELALHNRLRAVMTHALEGYPDAEYLGRNGLHCLAESCLTYNAGNNGRKRKRQEQISILRAYIIESVKKLCAAGVDVNNYDLNGNTPLMAFIKNPLSITPMDRQTDVKVLQILVDNGANVHRRNFEGRDGASRGHATWPSCGSRGITGK